MSKLTSYLAALVLVATLVAIPSSAMARGSGGPAGAHRGCISNNGIPLDDGQSVVVDGVTITCNNGTVCHFAAGSIPLCYVNVQAMQAVSVTPTGSSATPKHLTGTRLAAALKKARATRASAHATTSVSKLALAAR